MMKKGADAKTYTFGRQHNYKQICRHQNNIEQGADITTIRNKMPRQ
jgi:hypothetical protein